MRRYIQHEDLKISHFTAARWEHPVHNHNHFEIIFIHRGKGRHCLSGHHYPYSGKCLFFLAPSDTHHFDIDEETTFTFLKFTNVYLDIPPLLMDAHLRNVPLLEGSPEAIKADKLIRLITEEWKSTSGGSNEMIYFLIQALLSLIRRNVQQPFLSASAAIGDKASGTGDKASGRGSSTPASTGSSTTASTSTPSPQHAEKISAIINYLHSHIYSPEHTHLEHLAEKFGYSRHYLGIFFKEQTGIPLRDYVHRYKLHLIEHQLQYSSHSIKEISNEMGFTDQSHFNKFFKTHKGLSPSAYRDRHNHPATNGTKH